MVRTADKRQTVPGQRRRFTADEYIQMIEAGIIMEGEKVELIDGEILCMCATGSEHVWCVNCLNEWLVLRLAGRAIVSIQNTIRLSDTWLPDPDVVIARLPRERYRHRLANAEDILLLIEVSDTSRSFDRGRKLPMYARMGVTEVWLVDIPRDRFEVYREPGERGYANRQTVVRGQAIAPLAFPDLDVPVDEILPPKDGTASR